MAVEIFFDTNILLYAYDTDAGEKRTRASALVAEALRAPTRYALSVQVLQEFFVNFIRSGQSDETAATLIDVFFNGKSLPTRTICFSTACKPAPAGSSRSGMP